MRSITCEQLGRNYVLDHQKALRLEVVSLGEAQSVQTRCRSGIGSVLVIGCWGSRASCRLTEMGTKGGEATGMANHQREAGLQQQTQRCATVPPSDLGSMAVL